MGTYTTVQGDTWDAVAHRQLGGAEHTGELMAANRAHWGRVIFPAGVVLTLPEKTAAERFDVTMPPWKREIQS